MLVTSIVENALEVIDDLMLTKLLFLVCMDNTLAMESQRALTVQLELTVLLMQSQRSLVLMVPIVLAQDGLPV